MTEIAAATDRPPFVAVMLPSPDYVLTDFAACLTMMVSETIGRGGLGVGLVTSKSSIITTARDRCIEALEGLEAEMGFKADWIFWMDCDMVVPTSTINRLVAHNKDVVGLAYAKRVPDFETLVWTKNGDKSMPMRVGLVEVAGLPTGALLMRRNIFDKFKKPYFRLVHDEERGITYGEDNYLCRTLTTLGYTIWCDTDLSPDVIHIGQQGYKIAIRETPKEPADVRH